MDTTAFFLFFYSSAEFPRLGVDEIPWHTIDTTSDKAFGCSAQEGIREHIVEIASSTTLMRS